VNRTADVGAKETGISISALCEHAGMSRQNYYAVRRLRQRREIDEALIVELVKRERRMQPRLGGRKLMNLLGPELETADVCIGRDRFFEVLAENDLLVAPKPGRPHTTDSRHSLPVFHNLLREARLLASNEAWVSDLTYIRTNEGFMYAALITDAVSPKIVGAHIGDSLEAEGCLKALEMDQTFRSKHQARKAFEQAVWLYNHRRPHLALNFEMPAVVHARLVA